MKKKLFELVASVGILGITATAVYAVSQAGRAIVGVAYDYQPVCAPIIDGSTYSGTSYGSLGLDITENCDPETGVRNWQVRLPNGTYLQPGSTYTASNGFTLSLAPNLNVPTTPSPSLDGPTLNTNLGFPTATNLVNVETDPAYFVAGTGLFTGDLNTDILLRKGTDLRLLVMSGAYAVKEYNLGPSDTGTIGGLGDFDQDGAEDDVLYVNNRVLSIRRYHRNASNVPVKGTFTTLATLPSGSTFAGIGDFDHDGYNDDFAYMVGTTRIEARTTQSVLVQGPIRNLGPLPSVKDGSLSPSTVRPFGVGDYDNDGFEDDIYRAGFFAGYFMLGVAQTERLAADGAETTKLPPSPAFDSADSINLYADADYHGQIWAGSPNTVNERKLDIIIHPDSEFASIVVTPFPQNIYLEHVPYNPKGIY